MFRGLVIDDDASGGESGPQRQAGNANERCLEAVGQSKRKLDSLFAVALDIDVDHHRCERHRLFRLAAIDRRTDRIFRLSGDRHERYSASPPPAAVPWSEYIEALLLLAIQRAVKRVECGSQDLHGLRHCLEPAVHHRRLRFRRRRGFRLAFAID